MYRLPTAPGEAAALVNERDYLGTVDQIQLSQATAAVLSEGQSFRYQCSGERESINQGSGQKGREATALWALD